MKKWKCIILDDEDVDRLMVLSFAKRFTELEIVGTFDNSKDTLAFLEKENVDILFLDIDMPGINGLEIRERIKQTPICIYISGHTEYAAKSFELETLDFIVKPIRFERFEKTMKRINEYFETKSKADLFDLKFNDNTITIKQNNTEFTIKISEIIYLEALKDYTLLITNEKKHCVWSNIGTILKQDIFSSFTRVHRSYAIQKQYISHKKATTIFLLNGTEIPLGRTYKKTIEQSL